MGSNEAITPSLSIFWKDMSKEEKLEHYNQLGNRILEHRYRYYVLDDSVVQDNEYDYLERYYKVVADNLGLEDITYNLVGHSNTMIFCQEAKARVDNGTDYYSLWEKQQQPIWDKIGKSKHQVKKEE